MWQRPHSEPLRQPCGFQYHAQGAQRPKLCSKEPTEGKPSTSMASVSATGFGAAVAWAAASSSSSSSSSSTLVPSAAAWSSAASGARCAGGWPARRRSARASAASSARASAASASAKAVSRRAATLPLLRFLISPGGHWWQWRHPEPLRQPNGFQNHAQGVQRPSACRAEPRECPGSGGESSARGVGGADQASTHRIGVDGSGNGADATFPIGNPAVGVGGSPGGGASGAAGSCMHSGMGRERPSPGGTGSASRSGGGGTASSPTSGAEAVGGDGISRATAAGGGGAGGNAAAICTGVASTYESSGMAAIDVIGVAITNSCPMNVGCIGNAGESSAAGSV
mmetsp:Transcript_12449/g.43971  ORF Transcript_12449/g.43971 Transcript_12449/m.43971 type:complete len:340 (-) Transcript_12449:684-1703(-)